MRVYVSADIEGVAGVTVADDIFEGRPGYDRAASLLRGEVLAAVRGARDAGAREVIVRDAHGSAANLSAEGWPAGVRLLSGWADTDGYAMVQGIGSAPDLAVDALVLVGYHAGSEHDRGNLAHTLSPEVIHRVEIDGRACNEAVLVALEAGEAGVPVVALSGDRWCVEEFAAWSPRTVAVVAKTGLGHEAALHRRPEDVRDAIYAAVQEGLALGVEPLRLGAPAELRVRFAHRRQAQVAALVPGAERDGDTVAIRVEDGRAAARMVELLLRLGGTAGGVGT